MMTIRICLRDVMLMLSCLKDFIVFFFIDHLIQLFSKIKLNKNPLFRKKYMTYLFEKLFENR